VGDGGSLREEQSHKVVKECYCNEYKATMKWCFSVFVFEETCGLVSRNARKDGKG
jgi:hypothetical protein